MKTNLRLLTILSALFISGVVHAQNSVSIGTDVINQNAVLWLNGNGNQGFIIPIVNGTNAIATPEAGMVVFDDSDDRVYYHNGAQWVGVGGGSGGGASYTLQFNSTNNELTLLEDGNALTPINLQQIDVGGDITGTAGSAQVTGIRNETIPSLPTSPSVDQLLAWDGTAWSFIDVPSGTFSGVTTDVTISGDGLGTPLSVESNQLDGSVIPNLPDNSDTNEVQSLQLFDNGTSVDIDPTLAGSGITLNEGSNIGLDVSGNTITINAVGSASGDMSTSTYDVNTNNTVDDAERLGGSLPATYLDNTDNQDIANVLGQGNNTGGTTITGLPTPVAGTDAATRDYVDTEIAGISLGTDSQDLSISGDNLSLTGDPTPAPIDLSGYMDNTDNQTLSVGGGNLSISGGNSVPLTSLDDGDNSQTNELQDLDLTGDTGSATTGENFNLNINGGTGVTIREGTNIAITRTGGNLLTIGSTAAASGEANTASNVGSAGVGVFKQKTSADLEFKNINAGSNLISVTDDVGNDEVDINVNQGNLALTSSQITDAGTIVTQDANNVNISGGTISGVTASGTFSGDGSGLTGITSTVSTVAGKISGDGSGGTPLTIATDAITATELADGAVSGGTGGIITDNSITGADISSTADITANSFTGDGSALTLIDAEQIRSTAIDPSLSPALDEVLKWDGSQWTAQPDVAAGSPNTFAGAGAPGIVPDPVTETGNFLRDDGTWAVPAGAGDMIGANNLSELTNIATAQANLGLGSVATLNEIGSGEITNNSITGTDISTTADITANSFTGDGSGLTNVAATVNTVAGKISGDGSAGTPLTIATDAITATELADGSVSGGAGGTITDNSITGADISTTADITANSFTGDGSGLTGITSTVTVDGSTINGDGSGTPLNVPTDGITTTEILDGTVSSTDIANSTIVDADIAPGAAIAITKIAGVVDNDAANEIQTLSQVLTEGNSAGNAAITNLLDPTNPQDAATMAYVDANAGATDLSGLSDVSLSSPAADEFLKFNGTDWINSSSIFPVSETSSSSGPLFDLNHTGGGVTMQLENNSTIAGDYVLRAESSGNSIAGYFINDNNSATNQALYAHTRGSGSSLVALGLGTGSAATFVNQSTVTNTATVLDVDNQDEGQAGRFVVSNGSNSAPVVTIDHQGSGLALDISGGDVDITNTVTAGAFVGDGSGLTNLPSGITDLQGAYDGGATINLTDGASPIDITATSGSGDFENLMSLSVSDATGGLVIGNTSNTNAEFSPNFFANTAGNRSWTFRMNAVDNPSTYFDFQSSQNGGLVGDFAGLMTITNNGGSRFTFTGAGQLSIRPTLATAISLHAYGTDPGNTSQLSFRELAANGNNVVAFKAPDALANDVIMTLPVDNGSGVLTNDGTGILSWSAAGGVTLQDAYTAGNVIDLDGTNEFTINTSGANPLLVTDDANGRIGIGTTTPRNGLHVASNNIDIDIGQYYEVGDENVLGYDGSTVQVGSNLAVPLAFWAGSERGRIDTDGDFGIGTTNPTQKLEVSGTGTIISRTTSTSGNAALDLFRTGNSNIDFRLLADGSDDTFKLQSSSDDFGTTTDRLIIDGGNTTVPGALGVSTTPGIYALNVGGESNFQDVIYAGGDAGTAGDLLVSDATGGPPSWQSPAALGLAGSLQGAYTGGNTITMTSDTDIDIQTSSGIRSLYIDESNGNVGIGHPLASAPERLTIWDGNIQIGADLNIDSYTHYVSDNVGTNWATGTENTLNGDYIISNATNLSDPKLFVGGDGGSFDGNVGIGTITPQNTLDVEGRVAIGTAYSGTETAPSNGLIVQGATAIGTPTALNTLTVGGANDVLVDVSSTSAAIDTEAGVRFAMFDGLISDVYKVVSRKNNATANSGSSDFIFKKEFSTAGGELVFMKYDDASNDIIFNDSKTTASSYGDVIIPNGNFAVGTATPATTYKTDIRTGTTTTLVRGMNIDNDYSGNSTSHGLYVTNANGTGSGNKFGIQSQVYSNSSNSVTGVYAEVEQDGSGTTYLYRGDNALPSSGVDYGIYLTGIENNYLQGDFGLGTTTQIGAAKFTISEATTNFSGMYVNTSANGEPFYGYAIDGAAEAYTYLDSDDGNKWKLNNSGDHLVVQENGSVGIGELSPISKLHVAETGTGYVARFVGGSGTGADGIIVRAGPATPTTGTFFVLFQDGVNGFAEGSIRANGSGGVSFNTTSDRRLKQNISDIENSLEKVMKIRPRDYEFIANPEDRQSGFIAQELMEIYPQAVSGDPEGDVNEEPMMVDYSKLTPLLTGAIQEQQEIIEEQKAEIEALKAKLRKVLGNEASTQAQLDKMQIQIERLTQILTAEASKDDE